MESWASSTCVNRSRQPWLRSLERRYVKDGFEGGGWVVVFVYFVYFFGCFVSFKLSFWGCVGFFELFFLRGFVVCYLSFCWVIRFFGCSVLLVGVPFPWLFLLLV